MPALRAIPLLLIVGVLYVLLSAVVQDRKLSIAVASRMQFAPATVRLRIRVEPDAANRAVTVGIVGDSYESSSLEQLDGKDAPITRWRTFKDVPAGEYDVIAELYRPPQASIVVRDTVRVIGRDEP